MQPGLSWQELRTISHVQHMWFCQNTKNTYQENREFMWRITIHEVRSKRGSVYILASICKAAL